MTIWYQKCCSLSFWHVVEMFKKSQFLNIIESGQCFLLMMWKSLMWCALERCRPMTLWAGLLFSSSTTVCSWQLLNIPTYPSQLVNSYVPSPCFLNSQSLILSPPYSPRGCWVFERSVASRTCLRPMATFGAHPVLDAQVVNILKITLPNRHSAHWISIFLIEKIKGNPHLM